MVNLLQNILSFGSSPFRKKEEDSKTQLQNLGIDTNAIDAQFEQDLGQQEAIKAQTITQDQFFQKVDNAITSGDFPDMSEDDIFSELLKSAKENNMSIEGIDIEDELGKEDLSTKIPEQVIQEDNLEQETTTTEEPDGSFVGGFVANAPTVVGNTLGFFADVLTPKQYEGLGDILREEGLSQEAELNEAFGVDADAFSTKAGQFTSDIATMFLPTPGGKIKVLDKLGKLSEKAPKVTAGIVNLIEKSPKLQTLLKIGTKGGHSIVDFQKFKIAEEGELLTPSEAGVSFALGPIIDKVFKTVGSAEITKRINEKMGKLITKFSPTKMSKSQIDAQLAQGTKGMAIVKAKNPDLILTGDDAVANFTQAAGKTRVEIGKELEKARGFGGVDVNPNVAWIDKMTEAIKAQSTAARKNVLSKLTKNERLEFNALNKYNSAEAITALEKAKLNLLSKTKNGKLSFDELDNFIIGKNTEIGSLYNKATKTGDRTNLIVDDAINSKLKGTLDKAIDEAGKGQGGVFRDLKLDYQAVRNAEDNITKIYSKLLRQKDASLTDFTDVFILSNLGEAVFTGNSTQLAKGVIQKLIRDNLGAKNDPNLILQEVFKLLDTPGQGGFASTLKEMMGASLKAGAGNTAGFVEEELSK